MIQLLSLPPQPPAPRQPKAKVEAEKATTSNPAPTDQVTTAKAEPKEWTVLYCMDGSNNLEPFILGNMLDLEKVGSNKDVNIVTQLTRGPRKAIYDKHDHKSKTNVDGDWVGCKRFYVTHNAEGDKKLHSKVLMDFPGCPNHGDPRTWSDFITWGMENYPAKHYMVVFSDHGGGFRGTGYDDLYDERLDLPELKQALETVKKDTGNKVDVVTFDSCLMATAEVGYQLRDHANYLVASEELVGAEGLPHIALLKALKKSPEMSGRDFSSKIVELAGQDSIARAEDGRESTAEQLSAIDLSKMGAVADASDKLRLAIQRTRIDADTLRSVIKETKHFGGRRQPYADFRDASHFCQNLQAHEDVPASVKSAAMELESAVQKAVVKNQNEWDNMEDAQGMAMYIPSKVAKRKFDYGTTDFQQDSQWFDWIQKKLG